MGENGWNRSGGNTKARTNATRFPVKWIALTIAGLFFVGTCLWLLWPTAERPDEAAVAPKNPVQIKEVTPAAAPKAEKSEPEPVSPKPIDPNARPTKVGEVLNGYVKLPSGRLHRQLGVVTNSIASRPKGKYEIFTRDCDNDIAGLLSMRPGDPIMDIPPYNGRFKRDFLESLEEVIIVSEKDTPEQAKLKRDVIAARIELKDALDRGEDIEQIMMNERRELQRLMRMKMEYNSLFRENLAKCESDADVEDLFAACNKLLEKNGIAPLKYGPIAKRNILRARQEDATQSRQNDKEGTQE